MQKKNNLAVSPVIGVILMVGITVILAVVISVFVFNFGGMNAKGPTASIQVMNNADTGTVYDMKIVHKGGERLLAGQWKISIVKITDPPEFVTASADFQVGEEIITTNRTDGGTVNVTNRYITSNPPASLDANEKYDVKIVVFPYKTMTVDAVVYIR